MSNDMKSAALHKLLSEGRLDVIEDIMPTFNRKHRDIIVEHFIGTISDELENFIPFFDKNQINRLREAVLKQEEEQ
jgi:hypothetical protein